MISSNRVALAPIAGASLNILPQRSPLAKRTAVNSSAASSGPNSLPLTPTKLDDLRNHSSTPTDHQRHMYSHPQDSVNGLSLASNVRIEHQLTNPKNAHVHFGQQQQQQQSQQSQQPQRFQSNGHKSYQSCNSISTNGFPVSIFNEQGRSPNLTLLLPSSLALPQTHEPKDKAQQASLAATKLKLKLLLAVYRLQKTGKLKSLKKNHHRANAALFMETCLDLNLNKAAMNIKKVVKSTNATPSKNFNKQFKPNQKKPTLSYTAFKKNQALHRDRAKFKLFAIKKDSKYYVNHKPAPLTQYDVRLPKIGTSPTRQLPSINKILKTPMRLLSRNLINPYLPNNESKDQLLQPDQRLNRWKSTLYTDETIDEDEDGPIRESTIIQGEETIIQTAGDGLGNGSLKNSTSSKEPLSSSPIRANTFGTPNLFSVAKSLLQLGSGFYQAS